ncbi:MAG: hypothetical protein P8177_11965 [Gemmatimonadota bacterium]
MTSHQECATAQAEVQERAEVPVRPLEGVQQRPAPGRVLVRIAGLGRDHGPLHARLGPVSGPGGPARDDLVAGGRRVVDPEAAEGRGHVEQHPVPAFVIGREERDGVPAGLDRGPGIAIGELDGAAAAPGDGEDPGPLVARPLLDPLHRPPGLVGMTATRLEGGELARGPGPLEHVADPLGVVGGLAQGLLGRTPLPPAPEHTTEEPEPFDDGFLQFPGSGQLQARPVELLGGEQVAAGLGGPSDVEGGLDQTLD